MVKCDFNKGNLGEDNNYIATRNDKITNFIGLSSIGDLFITDYENYWLYNGTNSDNNLKYTVNDKGRMFLDTTDDLNKVRPSICLNINLSIKDGKGISDNPYLLEVSDETNN